MCMRKYYILLNRFLIQSRMDSWELIWIFGMISRIKAICLKNGGRKNEVYYTLQSGRLFP